MKRLFAMLWVLLLACGEDRSSHNPPDSTPSADAGLDAAGADAAPVFSGYQNGTWRTEFAQRSDDNFTLGSSLLFAGDEIWVAYTEPDATDSSDQKMFVARKVGGTWQTPTQLVTDGSRNNDATLGLLNGKPVAVWSVTTDESVELWFSMWQGENWLSPAVLTRSYERDQGRWVFAPILANAPDGSLSLIYEARQAMPGTDIFLRAAMLTEEGLAAEPTTILQAKGSDCFGAQSAYDSDGTLHVAANCDGSIVYSTFADGMWTSQDIARRAGLNLSPSIATRGGTTVVTWTEYNDDGNIVMRTIAKGEMSEVAPIDDSNADDQRSAVGIDERGNILVAFHRFDNENWADVFVTYRAPEQADFAQPVNVSNLPDKDDWQAKTFRFDPSGLPHFLFDGSRADAKGRDVVHAWFAPH